MKDLQMIENPDNWPAWPYLPMKRYVEGKGLQTRLLWLGRPNTLFEANLFHLPKTKEEFLLLPHQEYSSPEEILQEGWVVD